MRSSLSKPKGEHKPTPTGNARFFFVDEGDSFSKDLRKSRGYVEFDAHANDKVSRLTVHRRTPCKRSFVSFVPKAIFLRTSRGNPSLPSYLHAILIVAKPPDEPVSSSTTMKSSLPRIKTRPLRFTPSIVPSLPSQAHQIPMRVLRSQNQDLDPSSKIEMHPSDLHAFGAPFVGQIGFDVREDRRNPNRRGWNPFHRGVPFLS